MTERSGALRGSRKPVVVYLTVGGVLGGVETYILANARQIREDYEIWVLVGYRKAERYYRRSPVDRVLFLPVTKVFSLAHLPVVVRELRRRRGLILHSNDLVTCLWGKLLSFLVGPSCAHVTTIHSVVTEHRIFGPIERAVVFGLNRWLARTRQEAFLSVSEQVRKSLVAVGMANPAMFVIHHAIEPPSVSPARTDLRPGKRVRVGFVGRLSVEKGPDRFLECVGGLSGAYEVHVFGDGRMRSLFTTVGSRPPILHGFVEDKREIYASLDVVCITSRTESFSFVLLEALSEGCQVLALSLPIFDELLEGSPLKAHIVCPDIGEMRRRIEAIARGDVRLDSEEVAKLLRRFEIPEYRQSLLRVYSHATRTARS